MSEFGIPTRTPDLLRLLAISFIAVTCSTNETVAPDFSAKAPSIPTAVSSAVATPQRTVADISGGPFTLFSCGSFDAIATFHGTITTTVFYDKSGQPARLMNQYHTGSVVTNSVTGKAIFGSSYGPEIITLESDGAQLSASAGVFTNFRLADGTHVVFSTGRVIQRFNPDGSVDTLFTAGPIDAYLGNRMVEICGALK